MQKPQKTWSLVYIKKKEKVLPPLQTKPLKSKFGHILYISYYQQINAMQIPILT